MNSRSNFNFWWRWLVAANIGVMGFGISMVLAPDLIKRFFSLALLGSASAMAPFDAEALRYITLAHAVMGSVMFGWGAAMMFTLFSQFRACQRTGWLTITTSMLLWYIPDTSVSLLTGFWQNAMLNTGFAILFAIPLATTYRAFKA